ncbi:CcmC ABC-type transport system involved in cytochrome c biogenesis, permease component [Candidatus Methylopumilus universalis]|jgi:cytochrome c-type biogenesis protein CcsB|uniref:c-type cytochrome biogenesis protein CcsB n=1 Tax=Candidatus Methylopumilus TaxID=1679002 RepID=UPI000EBE5335|nr:c-type cytochrome biogenesis protein CcsB [Candidatus Methylopumilus planktonicus]MDH4407619.1 c-type cytochrome biogenesis protein CcsB [Candidatus Methylopumilus sp.]QDC99815.1 c-type cytochrome biogenesis protein CcsB [Candidatus Methylopumilus planktonicus]GBL32722.1 cytochrome c biogenesis protein CcsA [Methylophilaceae bacterium]
MFTKLFKSSKISFVILNVLYLSLLLGGALYALKTFSSYMDIYEKAILLSSVGFFSWLGWNWNHFKKIIILVFALSLFAIQLYLGVLTNNEHVFLLKYLLSSQSAIMWMNVFFVLALVLYWLGLLAKNNLLDDIASSFTSTAVLFGFTGLLVRWYESYLIGLDIGHIPISNLYEVFILFCLITSLLYLFYEEKFNTKKLGAFVLIVINAAVGFILWYTFDRHADGVQPLVPALQSYWMKIHVPANFIGYGAFSIAAMVSIAYLLSAKKILASYLPKLAVLDDLIYKSIAIGFIFFTVATILGAIWAAEAWGGYWSWDPKETWALIVWLNYAAWLHYRIVKGLRGTVLAWWALIGLIITTFAFLGVNMFLSGLHSYGEL